MEADLSQQPSEIDQGWSVELKQSNSRPGRRGAAFDNGSCLGPFEMVVPALSARIEERHEQIGYRIQRRRFRPFPIVTALAGKCEILMAMRTTTTSRHDMFGGKEIRHEARRGKAILTALFGPRCNQPTRPRVRPLRHRPQARSPSASSTSELSFCAWRPIPSAPGA